MAEGRKHWHLTSDPSDRSDFGGRVSIRKHADHLRQWSSRRTGKPVYVVTCRDDACGPAGQPLTESMRSPS